MGAMVPDFAPAQKLGKVGPSGAHHVRRTSAQPGVSAVFGLLHSLAGLCGLVGVLDRWPRALQFGAVDSDHPWATFGRHRSRPLHEVVVGTLYALVLGP